MTITEFIFQIERELGFPPTAEQHAAIEEFASFLADRNDQSLMILRGSAGTGKTTVASAMVRTLHRLGQKTVLLAPTGRAAKVFALNSGRPASTIHRRIYRQKSLDGTFGMGFNSARDTLFMVDESSMISAVATASFVDSGVSGSSLLDDLLRYVYEGQGCRLLLIGDPAQLPPVGEEEAPALQSSVMRGFGMHVYESTLSEVVRQAEESGILWNATRIRRMQTDAAEGFELALPRIRFSGFADVQRVPGDELIESLSSSYSRVGIDDTMVVTRSNKRANIYNLGIRNTILDREDELTTGDLLMVVKNKYLSPPAQNSVSGDLNLERRETAPERPKGFERASGVIDFIANGDRARVQRVCNVRDLYGFRFADVWLQFPDYDDYEMTSTVLLDTLTTEAPALTHEQSDQLFQAVLEDYSDIPQKAERMKKMKEDPYYNALQVKFAYAVTCHKAQGGQWAHVYIDQGYMTDDMLTPDYVRWLYTAFTRATEKVFLVNWPKNQEEE